VERTRQASACASQSRGCTSARTPARTPARHAHALVSQGHARTTARARVRTSRARAAAAASTRQVVLGHQPVRQARAALSPRFSARFSERQTRANFPPKKYLTIRGGGRIFRHKLQSNFGPAYAALAGVVVGGAPCSRRRASRRTSQVSSGTRATRGRSSASVLLRWRFVCDGCAMAGALKQCRRAWLARTARRRDRGGHGR
jgi:hypothetical protein